MRKAASILRWLYGLFYLYVGASWFVHRLIGKPWAVPEENPDAQALVDAFAASGLVDPLIAATCMAGGLLLLPRRTAPLGIAVLMPLVVGIFLFHLVLTGNWPWGGVHLALLLVLAWCHRRAFAPLWHWQDPAAR